MIMVMHILVSGTVPIPGVGADDAARRLDESNKGLIFKKWKKCTIHWPDKWNK